MIGKNNWRMNRRCNILSAMRYADIAAHYRVKRQVDLARKLGTVQSVMSQWRTKGVPWQWQCQLQVETRGKLKAVRDHAPK